MRTIEKTIFRFDELSDHAKEKAREWWRNGNIDDNFWSEHVIEDAATIADMIGIDLRGRPVKLMNGGTRMEPAIYWSGFCSQGDGACFEGSYSYKAGSVKAIKAHAPQDAKLHAIAESLADVQKRYFYRLEATVKNTGRYFNMDIDVFDRDDNYRDVGDASDNIKEALSDFAHWIYRQLESAWEWTNADEQVDENIRINEYEFDEDGSIS